MTNEPRKTEKSMGIPDPCPACRQIQWTTSSDKWPAGRRCGGCGLRQFNEPFPQQILPDDWSTTDESVVASIRGVEGSHNYAVALWLELRGCLVVRNTNGAPKGLKDAEDA